MPTWCYANIVPKKIGAMLSIGIFSVAIMSSISFLVGFCIRLTILDALLYCHPIAAANAEIESYWEKTNSLIDVFNVSTSFRKRLVVFALHLLI